MRGKKYNFKKESLDKISKGLCLSKESSGKIKGGALSTCAFESCKYDCYGYSSGCTASCITTNFG